MRDYMIRAISKAQAIRERWVVAPRWRSHFPKPASKTTKADLVAAFRRHQ